MRHPFAGPTQVTGPVPTTTVGVIGTMVFAGTAPPQELSEALLEHVAAGLMKRAAPAPSGPPQDRPATTALLREEGAGRATTLAVGEEGSGRRGPVTTLAFPEEGAMPATRAFGAG